MDVKIEKDMNIVKLLTAQAKGERVESDKVEEANQQIQTMLADFNPMNRYMVAQLIGYAVTNLNKVSPSIFDQIADVKRIGMGDKAMFKVPVGTIKAIIHAKGATVPRSRVADKQVLVDTVSVSARPSVNVIEIRSGRKNMADLIRDAQYQMALAKNANIQSIFAAAIDNYSSPFFGQGSGFAAATFDPMLMHFRRLGGVAILGDPAILDKVAVATGFTTASGVVQFADDIMKDYHATGLLGSYRGAKVIQMLNGYGADGETPILDPAFLYILSTAVSPEARNLKIVEEGDVLAHEDTNIDDLSYDVRLDQFFGAAFIVGDVPTIGVYEDQNL